MDEKKQNVIIIDDQLTNIMVLSEILRDKYDVSFAKNGTEGLEIIKKLQPDIILLDIMMPDISGYDVCKILKADTLLKDIPVIFITAMSEVKDEIAGLALGAVDYITKPFIPELVKLRVKNQLDLKRFMDFQKQLAFIDGLTGIPNRRAFDDLIEREWLRAERNKSALSLIMIDIDYFKKYNDNFGHIAGDDCLKKVATGLSESLRRSSDFLARYGGEEFVCVLPETDGKGAFQIAEIMRKNIEELHIEHSPTVTLPYVTVSLGIASASCIQVKDTVSLINAADEMLYKAKSEGRNRAFF